MCRSEASAAGSRQYGPKGGGWSSDDDDDEGEGDGDGYDDGEVEASALLVLISSFDFDGLVFASFRVFWFLSIAYESLLLSGADFFRAWAIGARRGVGRKDAVDVDEIDGDGDINDDVGMFGVAAEPRRDAEQSHDIVRWSRERKDCQDSGFIISIKSQLAFAILYRNR